MKAGASMTRRITFLSGTFLLFLLFTFCSRETLLPLLCNRWYQKTIQRQTQLHADFQHGQMRLNETVLQIMALHVKVYLSSSIPRASIAWIGWFRWLTNWCSGGSGNQVLINVRLYIYIYCLGSCGGEYNFEHIWNNVVDYSLYKEIKKPKLPLDIVMSYVYICQTKLTYHITVLMCPTFKVMFEGNWHQNSHGAPSM